MELLGQRGNACCFSLTGPLEQNSIDWVACKQQTLISHSSGGWESQDQDEGSLQGLFYKGTNLIDEDSTLMT